MIAAAAGAGARLVVLTEMFATGFTMNPLDHGEGPGGATVISNVRSIVDVI